MASETLTVQSLGFISRFVELQVQVGSHNVGKPMQMKYSHITIKIESYNYIWNDYWGAFRCSFIQSCRRKQIIQFKSLFSRNQIYCCLFLHSHLQSAQNTSRFINILFRALNSTFRPHQPPETSDWAFGKTTCTDYTCLLWSLEVFLPAS